MLTVSQAVQIVQSVVRDYGTESIPLTAAVGRVLRENLYADRPFPPFHRVTMDGIALRYAAFAEGQRSFPIENIAPAGAPQITLHDGQKCAEVMTGAVLPQGADTVIRYEDLTVADGTARVNLSELKHGKNVHAKGFDRAEGDLLVGENILLSPAEIGVAATIGKKHLTVGRYPKTVIISTGDELVDIEQTPLPHQIRKSNGSMLQSIFSRRGIAAEVQHLRDEYDLILRKLRRILAEYDLVVLSGGVSAGKFDFLPRAFKELEVKEHFHKVKQRPGKPLWFGESREGAVIFALPGNPVSAFSCAQKYILPWSDKSLHLPERKPIYAALSRDFTFKPNLTYFLQSKIISSPDGKMTAEPVTGNGSGDLANLANADGFLELPPGRDVYRAGEVFIFTPYR